MPATDKQVGYTTHTVPGGSKVPAVWYFDLKKSDGTSMGEQTYTAPVPTVTVTAPAGTYTLTGGQRDDTGAEMGVPVTSAPFDFLADIEVTFVTSIV
jgi:hypothetical protein